MLTFDAVALATAPNINVIVLCGFRVPFAPFLRTD